MKNAARKASGTNTGHHETFVKLATRLSELAAKSGVRIIPFKDPALPYLTAASFAQREHALATLPVLLQVYEQMQERGEMIDDASSVMWAFCRACKYMPADGFQDKIQDDDMLDIYNQNGQLIFANLRFFGVTSYSLEDLYFRSWDTLYFHSPATIQEEIKKICGEIVMERPRIRDLRHLGEHTAVETAGTLHGIFQPTYFSPLTQQGKIVGFACLNRIIKIFGRE